MPIVIRATDPKKKKKMPLPKKKPAMKKKPAKKKKY